MIEPPYDGQAFHQNARSSDPEKAPLASRIVLILAAAGVAPKEIDYIVVNSSLFSPNPTMAAMVAERFEMREDVQQFVLAGRCCLPLSSQFTVASILR